MRDSIIRRRWYLGTITGRIGVLASFTPWAAVHAARHPAYQQRHERTKKRLGKQRGAKVARVEIARHLAESIWYMLNRGEAFAPAGPTVNALVA